MVDGEGHDDAAVTIEFEVGPPKQFGGFAISTPGPLVADELILFLNVLNMSNGRPALL
jgi:hypothetical protein